MEPSKTMKSRSLAFSAISILLLTACDPDRGGAAVTCPVRPDLPVRAEQGPPYAERMGSFLQGKLPEPTSTVKPSVPVTK
jgi:hypothetical protein